MKNKTDTNNIHAKVVTWLLLNCPSLFTLTERGMHFSEPVLLFFSHLWFLSQNFHKYQKKYTTKIISLECLQKKIIKDELLCML